MRIIGGEALATAAVRLVDGARARLVIVSATFEPPEALVSAIERALVGRGVATTLVVAAGERAGHGAATQALAQSGAVIVVAERLDAGCICSEREAIVGAGGVAGALSLGAHLVAAEDAAAMHDLTRALDEIRARAERDAARAVVERRAAAAGEGGRAVRLWQVAPEGYCIRCRASVPANPDRPLCRDCYESWAEHHDAQFPEKCCLACGAAERSSSRRPMCADCYGRLYA